MQDDALEDVLATHADALNQGQEIGARLISEHPKQADELVPLIQLASALKAVLVPVSASAFKARLGYELVNYGPPVIVLGRSVTKSRARSWFALVAAGSLLSAAGVAAFLLRRVRSVNKVAPQPTTVL